MVGCRKYRLVVFRSGVTCNSFSSDTTTVHPGYTAHQTPTSFTIAGADVNSINYGFDPPVAPTYTLSGKVYSDNNTDGTLNGGDTGLSRSEERRAGKER